MNASPLHDRRLFERLCLLRALYRHRGSQDRDVTLTVAEAIRYAEELLSRSAASTV